MAYYSLTPELKNKIWIMYLRKSRQDDPNETVEEVLSKHETMLQEWARNNLGREIPEDCIYREIISGGESIDEREEMLNVLAKIEDNNVAGILCRDPQRLTRGTLEDCGRVISTLTYTNTLVATPNAVYYFNDKRDIKYFEMELMRGRDYLDYVKEVLYAGRVGAVKRGCFIGHRPPFGYDRVKIGKDHTLAPNKNADIVRMIFDWYVNEQLSYGKIAFKLNEMGVKTALNKMWRKDSIATIVNNRHYIGQVIYNRRQKVVTVENGKKRNRRFYMPEEEWIIAEGKHPAIIDRETFEKAQLIIDKHPRFGHDRLLTNMYAGVLVCSKCGKSMSRHPYRKAEDRLECRSKPMCFKSVKVCDVTTALITALEHSELPDLKAKLENGEGQSAKIQKRLLAKLEEQMEQYRAQEEKQYDLLETGVYTQAKFEERNAALRQKIESCASQIQNTKMNIPKAIDLSAKVVALEDAISALKDDNMPADPKNKILKSILSRVELEASDGDSKGETRISLSVFLNL